MEHRASHSYWEHYICAQPATARIYKYKHACVASNSCIHLSVHFCEYKYIARLLKRMLLTLTAAGGSV